MERRETPQERYHKVHTVSVTIRLIKNTEQDILQKLNSVPNKAGYIKSLIRADIKNFRSTLFYEPLPAKAGSGSFHLVTYYSFYYT